MPPPRRTSSGEACAGSKNMADDKWQKVREIFDAALRQQPEARADFLRAACGDDESLLAEVQSLFSSYDKAEDFLATPAVAQVAEMIEADQRTLETGQTVGPYEIIGPLGSGGMGEVYLAKDRRLGRQVAVKVLNEKYSGQEANLARFVQEAKAASALNHPNILVIHEIGEAGDAPFIVSEFVEGQTLRAVLRERALSLAEVMDIALQAANALVAAHAARIIHRDIKPENLMLRPDGLVKALDFGLAKLVEPPALDSHDPTFRQEQTASGVILGTANYMSPEQAKGERVDARTDIFSLGALLYEMVAGRAPFAGDSMAETLANVINMEAPPLARMAANVPEELQRIVAKMLRKDRQERYQTMRDALTDLKNLRENLASEAKLERAANSDPHATTVVEEAATRDAPHITAATQRSFSQHVKRRSVAAVALAALLVGAVVFGWRYFGQRSGKQIESIAVMPFVNESENAEVEYLSDGMTEMLIISLSQLPNLDVKARSSVFRYKGKETNANKIAGELNVQAILNGKVRQRGNELSLYVELVEANTEKVLWSQTYNRPMTNLVSLQNEIALDVSQKLKTKLSNADEQKLAKSYTASPEAYQLYLRGNYHVEKRTEKDIRKGVEYLEQAVAVDPNYALAYAGLARAYIMLVTYGKVEQSEVIPKIKNATNKALSLDNDISEAHTMLGYIKTSEGDDAGAEREYQRAIELNPNSGIAYHFYCQLLFTQGKLDETLAKQERALEVEPLSLIINREYGSKLFFIRRYDEAIAQFKKTIELDYGFPSVHYGLALAYQMNGNYAEAVEEQAKYQELIGEPDKAALLREGFAKGGWRGFLSTITDERHQFDLSWDSLVTYYAALGDKDKAVALLNKRFENRKVRPGFLIDPRLDPLRDDPRFAELVRRAGL
jgi:serine/threonine protein kinase/Tfp pilus assembly protein PilF